MGRKKDASAQSAAVWRGNIARVDDEESLDEVYVYGAAECEAFEEVGPGRMAAMAKQSTVTLDVASTGTMGGGCGLRWESASGEKLRGGAWPSLRGACW